MDDMEQKLNSILGNPDMMAQIMNMAQAMGANQPHEQPAPEQPRPPALPAMGIDPAMLQKIAMIAQQSGIDNHQQGLLRALRPYLHEERIVKLEKAMRAAKIANLATTFFSGGIPFLQLGR